MKTITIRYARVIILEHTVEIPDDADAETAALQMEMNGKLALSPTEVNGMEGRLAPPGSEIVDVEDYDVIWEVSDPTDE